MAYTCVRVTFEIGHTATVRNEPTGEGFTHDWELYLRGAEHTEIHHFVEKVVFHLHESFPNHRRVVKEPPYMVCETGYAGFPLMIDIYLKNKHEPSKIRFHYHLTLQPKGPPLTNTKKEKYVFKNPSEDFRRKLIKGGGVGVGADSASGSHTNHMAALNNDHSTDEHKSVNNKNKSSPQDVSVSSKKSKKENTPKNEEQLSANDPFSIFGQPIKTSKIPLVSKSSSKNQISDKQPPSQEKQSHSSKSSKHSSSSHKDKDKDKERGGGGSVEKEKTKDKDRDKNSMKRSSKESSGGSELTSSSSKKDKFKDDKVRILKVSSKDDSKKNSYHEEKSSKEKSSSSEKSSSAVVTERGSSSGRGSADSNELLKFEKKEKDKKHKDEKKSKSKDKYKQNEKKENIDVVMKESYVNERSEKLFSNKDDYKEEKKFHRIANNADDNNKDNKAEKISSKDKGGGISETKNLYNNVNNNNNTSTNNNNGTDSQIINNGDNTQRSKEPAEVKHKHHKHKKDKSKKDSKRDKEERKEKKDSKENKERFSMESQPPQQQHVQPQPAAPPAQAQPPAAAAVPQSRSTPKSASTDSPRRLKKPVKALFELDNSDSELSSMDDDLPPPSLPPAHHRLMPAKEMLSSPSPEMTLIKEEPMPGYDKHEEQTKEEKYETATSKKKKKNSEERENKKRKRKSKDKEENATSKMIKYETNCSQAAELAGKPADLTGSDRSRQPKSVSPSETKFTDEYITKLKELQRKIMTLEDNSGLQRIVQVVAETGQYEITTKTFDFDLCTLDESIVQRLLDFFVP